MTTIRFDDRTLRLTAEGLPALTGTEKQVAWAETIRVGLFEQQVAQRFDALRGAGKIADIDAAAARINGLLAPLLAKRTEAKYWIDHRNKDLQIMAKETRVAA